MIPLKKKKAFETFFYVYYAQNLTKLFSGLLLKLFYFIVWPEKKYVHFFSEQIGSAI